MTSREIVEGAEASVAVVADALGNGSGFLIAEDVLATNYHVVAAMFPTKIGVRFPARGGAVYRVLHVLHSDPNRDLCLLKVSAVGPALALTDDHVFHRGEDVIIIGSPGAMGELVLENAVTKGLLSSVTRIDGEQFYQISASLNPGNSGGPVLDSRGRVVCIATLKSNAEEGLAFGIPASDVSRALRRIKGLDRASMEAADELHVARAVYARTAKLGAPYLLSLALNATAMQAAVDADEDPSLALFAVKARYEDELKKISSALGRDLIPHANLTRRALHLNAYTKKSIVAFWNCVEEIRDQVDDPGGDVRAYIRRAARLQSDFVHLAADAGSVLGIGE